MVVIQGISHTSLKQIPTNNGDVWHCLKASEPSFHGFGEAYFSFITLDAEKPWRLHKEMTCNLIVNLGEMHFTLEDGRENSPTYREINTFVLSEKNYGRLTIPPGIWLKFKGVGEINSVLNLANIPHDSIESIQR